MNIVDGFDIDTVDGAKQYLEKVGFDVEEMTQTGLTEINKIIIKLKNK